jgi:ubiquinone/menaquinone biosynthesis C-methylase UbiE
MRFGSISHKLIPSVAAALLLTMPARGQVRSGGNIFDHRDEWQRTAAMIGELGDVTGKRIADVAAGTGYLTRHLSRAVGAKGRVYAVDIGETELAALRVIAASDSFSNVEVIGGGVSDPHLPDGIDGAMVLNSYHEFAQYDSMLVAVRRALRPGGRLVMVDNQPFRGWTSLGRQYQAQHHSIDVAFVETELRAAGFEIVRRDDEFITDPISQWLIVAQRPPSP